MKKAHLIATIFTLVVGLLNAQSRSNKNDNTRVLMHYNVTLFNTTGINTPHVEFSPMYYKNGIVFVSSRQKFGPIDEKLGETFFDIYYSDLDPNGMPQKPEGFSLSINSPFHEGPLAFNRKGDRIYFTRSNQSASGITKADQKGKVWLKIYEAQTGPYDWENIRELPFNGDTYSCMHPSLSPDGMKLFFSSTMPGGYGGRDIYMSEKQGDTWSKPVNLGPEVNSEKDEAFPFFHESGVLFFASDGHSGYGGLDLFMLDLSTRTWGKVVNLGKPFNTPADDFGIIINPDGTGGYFSSNREGGMGKDDIYLFDANGGLEGLNIKPKVNARVIIFDASNSRPVAGASIRIFEQSKNRLVANENLYKTELAPSADDPSGLVFKMKRKSEAELDEPDQISNKSGEALLPVEENKEYIVLISKEGYTTQEVKYSMVSGEIPRPIEVALQPLNCLGLSGIARSNNGKHLLVGVLVRIVNACTGKEEVLSTDAEGRFESCLEIGCDYTITSEKKGYAKEWSEISTTKIRGSRTAEIEMVMTPTSVENFEEPLHKGSVIILENIYYDFDKSSIRAEDNQDLEALAQLMKAHPSMEIELIAHTDSRGDNAYNLTLSLRRAESAKNFLQNKGIASNRIRAFGYGESQLRNHCKDGVECAEEEHQRNRRTEVIVVEMSAPVEFEYREKNVKKN
ncbi:MAG: OmpA family protein [Saprospiraceae bacterium]|nr:OmpA family protein [Saprospiraceae bacterium]